MTTPASPRIAVVGCGNWGRNLVRNFALLGTLDAVVDTMVARAEALATAHGVPARDWLSVLRDSNITAVALATPAEQHAGMALEALRFDKHVFVEKPLALTVKDGERVVAAADKAGRTVMVGHLLQFHPAFLKLKSIVQDGGLGRLLYIFSNRLNLGQIRREEDVLWSFAPHDLSMILSLAGEAPNQVEAHHSSYLHPHIADLATVHLSFATGLHAHVFVSWLNPFKEQKLVVVGDAGMAVFNDGEPWERKLCLFPHSVAWKNGMPAPNKADAEPVLLKPCEPLADECNHFIECVRGSTQPRTHVDEGLSVLRVLAAAEDAMRQRTAPAPADALAATVSVAAVHETAIVDNGCAIGQGTRIWHFSHVLKGTRIGQDCIIGQNVMIGPDVTVGNGCKIQNNVSLYQGVELEDGVFCGPSCVFTNIRTPRATIGRRSEFLQTTVRRGATVGANATVICGNELGAHCMIGAGTVVTKPVPAYALMVGNPARRIGWVSAAGERLGRDLVCPRTGKRYREQGTDFLMPIEADRASLASQGRSAARMTPYTGPHSPFIDLKTQQARIRESLDRRIAQVLDEGHFIMGPEVARLEGELGAFTAAAHVVSCANGTDALTLALMALELRPGDAVLLPTFTFAATAEVVPRLGAVPVFVDIEPDSLTIDPTLIDAGVQAAHEAGHQPVGIIAVDLFGQPAQYNALHAAAAAHALWVVADAAQSFGANIRGRKVGTLAKITTTSFFPAKPLGCYGDGGAVLTDDANLAAAMRSLRVHGQGEDKYDNVRIGLNSRLDTIQAAVLLAKLEVFADEMEARQQAASRYDALLAGIVTLPVVREGVTSAWAQYTVRSSDRDDLSARLHEAGIPTNVYYSRPLHTQSAYRAFPVAKGACPVAEQAAREVLSLPMHPYLDVATQKRVAAAMRPNPHG